MNNYHEIIKRLKFTIGQSKRKVTDKELSKILGMKPANFSNMKQKGNIPTQPIMDYCALNKISINWIFYGQVHESLHDDPNESYALRFFDDINASCGFGVYNNDNNLEEIETINIPKYILDYYGYIKGNKNLHIINIIGDSMEPTIPANSKLLVNTNLNIANEKDIFVISTIDGVFAKRLKFIDNGIVLKSDNKAYSDIVFSGIDININIIGKVIGIM